MFIHVFRDITCIEEEASKRHLLFEFHDKMDRIGKLKLSFLSEVIKHKAYCDYWMRGAKNNIRCRKKNTDMATLA